MKGCTKWSDRVVNLRRIPEQVIEQGYDRAALLFVLDQLSTTPE